MFVYRSLSLARGRRLPTSQIWVCLHRSNFQERVFNDDTRTLTLFRAAGEGENPTSHEWKPEQKIGAQHATIQK